MHWIGSIATVFGLGFVYFISAIPAGVALKVPVWAAAIAAWIGYSAGGLVVAFAGEPVRVWLMRRLKVKVDPQSPSLLMRAWRRYGLPALGFLAPVTIGPQAAALLGLALGTPKMRLVLAIAIGGLPWAAAFGVLVALGVRLVK